MLNMQSINLLNCLLQGKLSTIESYEQALFGSRQKQPKHELIRIVNDHRSVAETLRRQVRLLGGIPAYDSGTWGILTKITASTARLFGETAALRILKKDEERSLKKYYLAVDDLDLIPHCRNLINFDLVSRQRQHISALDRHVSQG